jgi:hypothetical protein
MGWHVRGGILGKVEVRVILEMAIACFNNDHRLLTRRDLHDG